MVAINFKERFADDVELGYKTSTIRKTKRCGVGDSLTFYTGQRTKECRKLGQGVCVDVFRIIIDEETISVPKEDSQKLARYIQNLYENEGFDTFEDFIDFFRDHYGLPFDGWFHAWELKR